MTLLRIEGGEAVYYPCECGHAKKSHRYIQTPELTVCLEGCACREYRPEKRKPQMTLSEALDAIAMLRARLRPFAAQWEIIAGTDRTNFPDDAFHFRISESYASITITDCRRAFEALMELREMEVRPR